jgi:putative sterol carrier protein
MSETTTRADLKRLTARAIAATTARASDPLLERTIGRPRGLRAIFKAMTKKFVPTAAEGFVGCVTYELRGEDSMVRAWTVQITPTQAIPVAGRLADPALTIKVGLADFIRISAGGLKPVDLVMSGRMQLEGDFMLAAKLGPMFGEPVPGADSA